VEEQPEEVDEVEARARTALSGKFAMDFSHGAVYFGYVTEHYPPDLERGEMTKELFHVECDDGDEKDMDGREVAPAIELRRRCGI